MKRSIFARSIALATLVPFLSLSCGGKKTQTTTPTVGGPSPLSDQVLVQTKDLPPGLDLRLSNGREGPPAFDRNKLPPAKKLDESEAQALLARTKAIQKDPDDQQAFALRAGSQPAPRTGNVIKGQFPAPPSTLLPPKANDAGKALSVLRYMPEGQVPLAPELSVTFSQPMIAVTSQSDAAQTVPVELSPQPKGNWRWIGTRTIVFDPETRFPQATTYRVKVKSGTKSANGGALDKPVEWTFETPAPKLVSSYPYQHQPQKLDAPMFALFDQKIDADKVLDKISVRVNGTKKLEVAKLSADEIAKDKHIASLVEAATKSDHGDRWVAFRAKEPFPKDAAIEVMIDEGTPSAEGPNRTKELQSFSFRTFPPLRIERSECGYRGDCPPGQPYSIQFNNPLDEDRFDTAQITVTPDVAGLKVTQSHGYVALQGFTKARTTYQVVVSGGVLDDFGQTLGKDTTLTWRVTDARPTFFGPSGLVVLDPMAKKPSLDFFSTNYEQLKVKLYKVEPRDYDAFENYLRNQWNKDKPPRLPGTKVLDTLVATTKGANELVETRVELASALRGGFGHAIAVVEPYPWKERWDPPRLVSWVQSTKIGIDAYVDAENLVAFATDLTTGKPAANVALEIAPFGIKATTDDKGLASLPLGSTKSKGTHMLVAKRGDDVAFVTDNSGYWNEHGSWNKQAREKRLAWYVIDDRKMYKPGEEVSLKGLLRVNDTGKGGDIGGLAGAVTQVTYTVKDSRGNQIGKGAMPVSAVGGFDTKFTLPKTPNLGHTTVELVAQGRMTDRHHHYFQIEEFRRPEFEVSASASQGPFLVGQSGDVTVNAKYYAGGPLAGAPVSWYVTANQTSFTPPNRDEFTFGQWVPWWSYHRWDDSSPNTSKSWSHDAKTDASGAHIMHLDFLSANPAMPYAVTANASVSDVNRQTWSASAAMIVHPSKYYVGLKPRKPFVEKGQPFEIDVIGVNIDGAYVPGTKLELKAVRLDWEYKKGKYTTKEVDPQTCSLVAADKPLPCQFATKDGGTYQITATIVDDKGRANQTKLDFWVTGGDQPPSRELEQERVMLVPDKKEYKNGDTAELLVSAPFYPAEGVVTWRRSGIVKTERITLSSATTTIKVPITDNLVPNMAVQVDLVGAAPRLDDNGDVDPKLPKRPAYAVGSIDLPIPPKQRTLAVEVSPDAPKLAPGESSKLTLVVKDAAGRPVPNAEAVVIVVDEAILSLTGYQFPNPIDTFYGRRGTDTRDHYSRAYVRLAKPDVDALASSGGKASGDVAQPTAAAALAPEPMEEMDDAKAPEKPKRAKQKREAEKLAKEDSDNEGDAQQAIAMRSNFNPLAAFSPAVKTGADGRAVVDVKLPDNLTRYRIVAIATAGEKQFGKGENSLTARLPLMVRPSPPRFLNFGDTFKLPVVLQNQTDAAMTVKLAVRASNATITDGSGREVVVPPNDRVEVQVPAAAELAGTARFQIVGASGKYTDAAELALPVWTPATTEAFATYGVIDDGAIKQPVALPGKVVTQFGGIEVQTASTNLQSLTDALIYLVKYPYECAEQRASRVLAIAALRDVLTAFKTKDLPSKSALEQSVTDDIERLSQMQNYDGGYAFWERGYPSIPYLTVFVTNALVHAKAKGFAVNANMIERAKPYLKDIENHYPWFYPKEVRWTISAYALYTRKQMGDVDVAKATKLLREAGLDKLPMEAVGWLLGTLAQQKGAEAERKQIVRHVMNRVSETAGAANFTTRYSDGAYLLLASDRRVDAVILESLIAEDKNNDLIPKVVTGLLAHRKAGRWLNTQENTFALSALDLYFQTYEKVTPDFVARVWLGNDYAGDHAFKGRTTDYFTIPIAMKDVATRDKQPLTIQKDGKGRLYYRIGMKYAPASLKLDPADYGFVVQRTYEGVDDPKDVVRQADGTWKIKAGARVRVNIKMVNENRRYHVALVDPMPAGLEPMNPALAVTGPIPTDPNEQKSRGAYWWWYGPWYEHQNMRDERVEAFASLLWEGVHSYSYVARATTPGNFVVPPPKAEEMYMPETFGRGGSDRVIVE